MTKTILLADDSVTIQKVVELAFVQNGYEVHAVGSGDEAITRLETLRPDVVISDVHMPGASGYDVCRAAKQRYAGIPVLLLVGAFESFDPSDAANCGANATLKKPFDSKELFSTVDGLVVERHATAEAAPAPVATEPSLNLIPDAAPAPAAPVFAPEPAAAAPVAEPSPLADFAPAPAAPTPPAPPPSVEEPPAAAQSSDSAGAPLSEEDVDRIARRVAELLGDQGVREVAWEVIPDLAEIVIKDRIRELESQVE